MHRMTDSPPSRGTKEWVVVDKEYRDYYYKPEYTDTNGVIDTFYFGQSANTNTVT
jgi:hypothetical protein